jgi:RES domain-containing protein
MNQWMAQQSTQRRRVRERISQRSRAAYEHDIPHSVTRQRHRFTAHRAARAEHDDLRRTAESSCKEPGRFNTANVGAVYASLDRDTAVRELLRSSPHEIQNDCAVFTLDVDVGQLLDFCDSNTREQWGVDLDELTADDMSSCQSLVPRIVARGIEVVRWPSATGQGVSIAVYLDRLGSGSRCIALACEALTPDDIARAGAVHR